MSDEETHIVQTEEGQMLTAEYKDGQLQIVEVTPFDKRNETHILSEGISGDQTKYMLDSNKGLLQLDLLNFTLVKCSDDSSTYQVMSTSNEDGDTTLTCVLSSEDAEDNENDSYVVLNSEEGNDPLVFLQSTLQQINTQENLRKGDNKKKTYLSPAEILEKAKALQKAKALLQAENSTRSNNRGRKRKSDLPPPMELLSSPNFKLYLYSCKMCNFKCNAVKEMSKHRSEEHGSSRARGGRSGAAALQCARCPYRAHAHNQLLKHVQEVHTSTAEEEDNNNSELKLDCNDEDLANADVLVCGACGFESARRDVFKKHIEEDHGVDITLTNSLL